MSILQGLIICLHLLSKDAWNERGWGIIPVGGHKAYVQHFREYATILKVSPEICTMISSLLEGYKIFESRFQEWATRISQNQALFDEQKETLGIVREMWEDRPEDQPATRIPILSILDLAQNLWIGAGRGTVMHKDTKNIGLSLAYYLGFDYGPSPLGYKTGGSLHHGGVGLPEKKFIWDHGPGSVMAIRAFNYYHMSCPPNDGLKMMGAAYVNGIK